MNTITSLRLSGSVKIYPETFPFARSIWDEYVVWINGLEPGIKVAGLHYIAEREYACIAEPPICVITPLLLAKEFGIRNPEIIKKIVLGNILLDHFSHLVDDLTDSPALSTPSESHLSHLLLARATIGFLSLSNHPETFSLWFDRYLMEAMSGERALWKHHKILSDYSDEDFIALGRRGGLMRICAAICADISDSWHVLPSIEEGLLEAAIGVQLLDDFVDCGEDLAGGIYTQPLVAAIHSIGIDKATQNPETVLRAIVSEGVADSVIQKAADSFSKAAFHFDKVQAHDLRDSAIMMVGKTKEMIQTLIKSREINKDIYTPDQMLKTAMDIRMQH